MNPAPHRSSIGWQLLLRLEGALVGGSLPALAAAVGPSLGLYWWNFEVAPLAQLGVIVGTALGFAVAPTAVATERPLAFALELAVKAVVIGLALYIMWSVVGLAAGSVSSAEIGGVFIFGLVAVAGAFVVALPVTLAVALVAVGIARLERNRPHILLLVVATLSVASVLVVTGFIEVPREWSGSDAGRGIERAPIRLEWTVANHSRDDLELSVWTPSEGGFGGWSQGIPACFTTTGRSDEEEGWFISLQDHEPFDDEAPVPPSIVSAAEAPGSHPQVWIEVAADRTMTVFPGRAAPSPERLIVDLCPPSSLP